MRPPTRHGRWWGSLAKPADKRTAGRSPASRCAQGSPRPFACTAPLLPGRGGQAERSPPCRATARTTVPEDYAFYAQSWIRFANDRRWVGRPQAGTRSAGRRGERVAHANPPPRARRRRWPPRRTSGPGWKARAPSRRLRPSRLRRLAGGGGPAIHLR